MFRLLLLLMYYVVKHLFTALRHWHRRRGILLLLFKIYICVWCCHKDTVGALYIVVTMNV